MAGGQRVFDSLKTSATRGRKEGLKTGFAIVWVVIALAILPGTREWFVFSSIQRWFYDRIFEWYPPRPPDDVVIVAIDERSIAELGRFPWSRAVHAELLRHLRQASAVGFDILFAEPQSGPKGPQADRAFAEAIRQHGRVVLAMHVADNPEVTSKRPLLPRGWPPDIAGMVGPRRMWMARPETIMPPVAPLLQSAAGVGFVDISPDPDGIYRRAQAFMFDGQRLYPHFAVELARVALGLKPREVAEDIAHGVLNFAGNRVPMDENGRILINFCGPSGTVPRISYCDVLAGRVSGERFKGKVVIVGATASGLYDIRPAPFSKRNHFYLGAELNASLCETLLRGPALADRSHSVPWTIVAGLVSSAVVALVWLMTEAWAGIVAGALLAVVPLPFFFAMLFGAHVVLPIGPLVVSEVAGWLWSAYRRLSLERNVVRQHFSAYVSPEVLAHLMSHPELVEQGQRREITLLFADIRGSTTIAEKMPAEEWIAQLNEYLTEMSEIILGFEGYLDKFMGDGIMAMWNAFGTQPYHRDLAVRAAVAMLQHLERLNEEWRHSTARTPLRIGIGIHTGEAIVGNVGSRERTQFTAIGDTVNAAARIEAATKEFGVPLVISEATVAGLAGKYDVVELGTVTLRGREEAVKLFTLSFAAGGGKSVRAQAAPEATDRAGAAHSDAAGNR